MSAELHCDFTDLAQADDLDLVDAGLHLHNLTSTDLAVVECGATVIHLDTFSFQAPDFYRRCGDETAARTDGFADGIGKHLMVKPVDGRQAG